MVLENTLTDKVTDNKGVFLKVKDAGQLPLGRTQAYNLKGSLGQCSLTDVLNIYPKLNS